MEIKQIKYKNTSFCKEINLILKSHYKYYGLYVKNELVSLLSIEKKNKTIKIRSNYTKREFRGKGYMTALIKYIMKLFTGCNFRANALETSYKIYESLGFEITKEKQFKSFKIYYMRLDNGLAK